LELFDAVELIADRKELSEKGIKQGYKGILICKSQTEGEWLAMFFNAKNEGDYAMAISQEEELRLLGELPKNVIADIKTLLSKSKFLEKTMLTKSKINEYDCVELAVEKDEYSRVGVHKGMRGCVVSSCAINGKWNIIFSENNTGKDIAEIMADENDLLVI
jgi:hypothetical protein